MTSNYTTNDEINQVNQYSLHPIHLTLDFNNWIALNEFEWIDEWINERINECKNESMNEVDRCPGRFFRMLHFGRSGLAELTNSEVIAVGKVVIFQHLRF